MWMLLIKFKVFVLLILMVFLVACENAAVTKSQEEQTIQKDLTWQYFKNRGTYLSFEIEQPYNIFRLDMYEGIVVPDGATTYGRNTLKISPCGSSTDKIEYCLFTNYLKKYTNFVDKKVDIYIAVDEKQNLRIDGEKPISYLKEQTQAKKVLKFDSYIPPIDDYGFVDIKYVDSSWCWVYTDESEFGEYKPKCEIIVNKIREEIKTEIDKMKPILDRRSCSINCENRLIKEQRGIPVDSPTGIYCGSDCCKSFMEKRENNEGYYYDSYLEKAYPVYGQDKLRYLLCSEELLDKFLESKK